MAVRFKDHCNRSTLLIRHRAHIIQDLQPYVCTFPDCSDGDNLYATRNAWIEHERLCHRRVWRCFEQQHKDALYKSKDQLHTHLLKSHADLGELQIQSFLGLAETTIADDRKACPFCNSSGPFDKGLHNHMAFHQESMATFAAPRNVDEDAIDEVNSGQGQGTRSAGSLGLVSLDFSSNLDRDAKALDDGVGAELYMAASDGHGEAVTLLLQAGADVNARSGQNASALYAAASNGHKEVVKLLLKAGADVDAHSGQSTSALYAAASNGHADVVSLLIYHGADVNAHSGQNTSALYAAASNGHEEVVKLLLDAGAEDAKQGEQNASALNAAISNVHVQVAELLTNKEAAFPAGGEFYNFTLLYWVVRHFDGRVWVCNFRDTRADVV